jgi:GNAT superfamily N-acetyltransferase
MIRPATRADVPVILRFIRELAEYERLTDQLDTDEAALAEHLFGARPVVECLLACEAGVPVGFALFFPSYSTFKTSPCLYLEDLFVRPAHRGRGHGLALMRALAALADERGYARFDWAVLDWNETAIGFYRRIGACLLEDWRICRLDRPGLRQLAT